MILEIVEFNRPEGFSADDLMEDARSTVAQWQANPDLIRKHFVTDGPIVMGVYVWPSRSAAQAAHDDAWVARFTDRTGEVPRIRYFDMFMVIDNDTGTVEEYPLA